MIRSINVVLAVSWLAFAVGCFGSSTPANPGNQSSNPETAATSTGGGGSEGFTPAAAPYQLAAESVGSFQKPRNIDVFFADETAFYMVTANDDGDTIRRKYTPASNQSSDEPISPSGEWIADRCEAGGNGRFALLSLVNTDFDTRFGILDATSGEIAHVFDPKQESIYHAISANGKKVVAASYSDDLEQANVAVFNTETGEAIAKTQISGIDLEQISISADGQRVVFGVSTTESSAFPLWDTSTNQVRKLATVAESSVTKISPDGTLIATTLPTDGIYPKLVLLDAESGEVSKTLSVDRAPGELVFSGDGKLLMAGWVLKKGGAIFDVASGGIVANLETDERFFEARFTTTGKYLAALKFSTDFDIDHDEMLVWELNEK